MKRIILISALIMAIILLLSKRGSGPIVSQNGISPVQFANDLISKYDRNSDDKLDVTNESFLQTELNGVMKVESRGLLFTDADGFGDSDGFVTNTELVNYLAEFDTDGDGELTSFKNIFKSLFGGESEWKRFDDKYGERFKYE